jgi:hypothetical protein
MSDESPNPVSAFCIYVATVADGHVPLERDERGNAFTYATREEAEREIAEIMIDRIHEYLAGERDFDDIVCVSEFVEAVELWPDGSVSDASGRVFSSTNWGDFRRPFPTLASGMQEPG